VQAEMEKPSYIILFYSPNADKKLPEAFIEGSRPSIRKYQKVIDVIKTGLFGERQIIKQANLKQTQFRVIKADLIEQGIIREATYGASKKYEFIPNSQSLSTKTFEELRESKMKDLEKMIEYIETTSSRMKFLCDYLGDSSNHNFTNCDNTSEKKIEVTVTPEWTARLQDFRENYFPELIVESTNSNIVNGVAASYYGVSNVGDAIHRSKYEGSGDFPDFLLLLTLKAFKKKFGQEHFDLVLYIPPTISGNLVKNFAEKVSRALKIPISHKLLKQKETKEQKTFENAYLKKENVSNVFSYAAQDEISGKNILLIDDIFDSGATIKELGRALTKLGVKKIAPLVIARTVGGDLV
jgi:ATP-dependent DNA helicase RecQ